jgi:hypothetical protein
MAQPSDPTPGTPPGDEDAIRSMGETREIINEIHQLLIELSRRLDALERGGERQRRRKRPHK